MKISGSKKYRNLFTKEFLEENYLKRHKSITAIALENNCLEKTVSRYLKLYEIPINNWRALKYTAPNKGTIFGKLIFTGKTEKRKNNIYYLCICVCGKEKWIKKSFLNYGGIKSCGCFRWKKDLENQKFGQLTATNTVENGKRLCYCDCGNKTWVDTGQLTLGATKSCGCGQGNGKKLNFGMATRNNTLNSYKFHAKSKNLCWELDDEQFDSFTKMHCFYCGSPPSNINKSKFNNGDFIYNGLDRLDNNKGYIKDNCVPCCVTCNKAKRNLSLKDFLSWVYRIKNHTINFDLIARR